MLNAAPESEVYRDATNELLAALGYAELAAFGRLASDAEMAPSVGQNAQLAAMAAAELGHHQQIVAELVERGVDPDAAMEPFAASIDAFHERTAPSTWLEALMKAYVGDGIGADFYREVAQYLDERTCQVIERSLVDVGQSEFAVESIRAAIAEDPSVAGRLALYGRRLMGEALAQAQEVAVARDGLAALLIGGLGQGLDLAELGALLNRLTDRHTERMRRLGLDP